MKIMRKFQEEDEMKERAEERRRLQEEEEKLCNLCLEPLYTGEWMTLEACKHMYHSDCLKEQVKNEVTVFL